MKRFMTRHATVAVLMILAVAPVLLGSIEVAGFPPLPKGEFKPAALGAKEPQMDIAFPGSARAQGVTSGSASVSVFVGADGQPLDFMVTAATHESFGAALLERARAASYQAATFRGNAVPARVDLGYDFRASSASLNVMEVARFEVGDNPNGNSAVAESALDQPLQFTNAALPRMPASYTPPDDQPVKVFVTFFVDEQGHARVPNIESAAAPVLFSGALKAVRQWTFQPPTVKGKPVTVFAGRTVGFIPRTPPPADAEKKTE